MDIKVQVSRDTARLNLSGRFDFTAHREFRHHCDELIKNAGLKQVDVDLGGVSYLDSSALGMLLLLKENAQHANQTVALVNCHGTVRQVLEVANFDKLFKLS